MIYNFRMVSDEVPNFRREIEIDADATFADLKNAICDSVNYDKNQMSSFFICADNWEKEKEITLEDMGSDSDQDVYLMEDSYLSDFIEDEGQHLMFTFDYMTDRSFFLEMKEIITRKNLMDPVCTLAVGNPPAQVVDIDMFDPEPVKKGKEAADLNVDELDESFYGSEEFNEDEFDEDAFGEMPLDE
ncbi:MAG: hypothetical protein K2H44_08050 [Muribaculaceae bacterium]|nr:hypothetical protein [Muribaculaceae bacterium]MDE5845319.1 hypothetical protein [Muribaculaceae bacterium]